MNKGEADNLCDYISACNKYFHSIGIRHIFFQYSSDDEYPYYKIYINTKYMKEAFSKDYYTEYTSTPANAYTFWEHLEEALYMCIQSPSTNFGLSNKPIHYIDDNHSENISLYYIKYDPLASSKFSIILD